MKPLRAGRAFCALWPASPVSAWPARRPSRAAKISPNRPNASFKSRPTTSDSTRMRLARTAPNPSETGKVIPIRTTRFALAVFLVGLSATFTARSAEPDSAHKTTVSIAADLFHINGHPTYAGRSWNGQPIEGLLFNSRMVQGVVDDLNPETASQWAYPDTGKWDPERNTNEFIAAMPEWRRHGLLAFTLNLQGGSPEGYSKQQPWENSAFD